jgi:CHASE2 domain-containing sensor protein
VQLIVITDAELRAIQRLAKWRGAKRGALITLAASALLYALSYVLLLYMDDPMIYMHPSMTLLVASIVVMMLYLTTVGAIVGSAIAGSLVERRIRHLKRGECVGCGYNLAGSSGRCPECGASQADLLRPR